MLEELRRGRMALVPWQSYTNHDFRLDPCLLCTQKTRHPEPIDRPYRRVDLAGLDDMVKSNNFEVLDLWIEVS